MAPHVERTECPASGLSQYLSSGGFYPADAELTQLTLFQPLLAPRRVDAQLRRSC